MVLGLNKRNLARRNRNNYSNSISAPHTKIPKPEILRSVPEEMPRSLSTGFEFVFFSHRLEVNGKKRGRDVEEGECQCVSVGGKKFGESVWCCWQFYRLEGGLTSLFGFRCMIYMILIGRAMCHIGLLKGARTSRLSPFLFLSRKN
jgi:hypothetical protein